MPTKVFTSTDISTSIFTEADQFRKELDVLDDWCNWTITSGGIFDWAKPMGVERTQITGPRFNLEFLKHKTTSGERAEALRA